MENQNTPEGNPPDNNLVWAIIAIIFCWPLGIVSIIKSTKVKTLWLQGDHAGAQKAASDAKKWAIWGIAISAICWILYILLFVVIGFAGGLGGF